MKQKNVYEQEYLPYINRVGQVTNWAGVLFSFGPALVLLFIFDLIPPIEAILTAFISIAGAVGVLWFVEPISYFPIIGVAGTYMAFMSGNISNMRIPCAAVAQKVAGVEPGSDEGSVIGTLGMAVSIIVNLIVLTIFVGIGQALLASLPPHILSALDYLLPALFGALFVQFAVKQVKLAAFALVLASVLTLAFQAGWFNFLPGRPSYLITIGSVFGTMAVGMFFYKKGWLA